MENKLFNLISKKLWFISSLVHDKCITQFTKNLLLITHTWWGSTYGRCSSIKGHITSLRCEVRYSLSSSPVVRSSYTKILIRSHNFGLDLQSCNFPRFVLNEIKRKKDIGKGKKTSLLLIIRNILIPSFHVDMCIKSTIYYNESAIKYKNGLERYYVTGEKGSWDPCCK